MFRRLRLFIGLNARSASSKRLVNVRSPRARRAIQFVPPPMLETVHEVAIYIHRFHNLDLFQQGWYQIKISMRCEDSTRETVGTPARVVQYEAPGLVSDDVMGVWRIDDADNSFRTQPFRIKYARQDVNLSVMISFSLPLGKDEIPAASAVILKFELMYAPILDNGSEVQAALDTYPAAVHEFRIPPNALLGLHSYCPVHFDAFHAVLVDLSVHIVLLKAGANTPSLKVTSSSIKRDDVSAEYYEEYNQVLGEFVGSKATDLVKSLSSAHAMLLEELQNLSKAIGQTADDLIDAESKFSRNKLIANGGSGVGAEGGRSTGQLLNELEKSNGFVDLQKDMVLQSLSNEELLNAFYHLGSQLSFLWNAFLKFHRFNASTSVSTRNRSHQLLMIRGSIMVRSRDGKSGRVIDMCLQGKDPISGNGINEHTEVGFHDITEGSEDQTQQTTGYPLSRPAYGGSKCKRVNATHTRREYNTNTRVVEGIIQPMVADLENSDEEAIDTRNMEPISANVHGEASKTDSYL